MSEGAIIILACYNVHGCVGSDGRAEPAGVGSVLREIDADVFGLPEVSVESEGEEISHQAGYLANAIAPAAV